MEEARDRLVWDVHEMPPSVRATGQIIVLDRHSLRSYRNENEEESDADLPEELHMQQSLRMDADFLTRMLLHPTSSEERKFREEYVEKEVRYARRVNELELESSPLTESRYVITQAFDIDIQDLLAEKNLLGVRHPSRAELPFGHRRRFTLAMHRAREVGGKETIGRRRSRR
jgi:hypothetical protein